MRVVIIINSLIACGAERLALDEAHELYRRGEEVALVTLRPEKAGNSFMPLCTLPESSRVYIHFSSLWDRSAWSALVKLLRGRKYDTAITHLWFANTIGRIAAYIARVPRIISFEHNVYDLVKTKKQFFADRILQRLSSRIIAVSDAVRDSLIRLGIKAEKIVVIANGIDLRRYQNAAPAAIETEEFTYLFVGRLVHQKGVDVLLSAFALLERGQLLIAGDGVDRSALEAQARSLQIAEKVHFLGVRDDIPGLMKKADCFVLPSRHEGMPIVLIEALASGCTAIVSDFTAAHEVLQDGISGIIVPIDNSKALADAMARVAADGELRARLSAGALHDVAKFSIKQHIDTLLVYGN